MKPSTVRGTPMRSISANNGQGFTSGGKPPGFQGTVNPQYAGESATPGGGTPYNSASVNDDRPASSTTGKQMGSVIDTQTGTNMNEPESNGNGVVFDGVSRERDYMPSVASAMDSPVPSGAQRPTPNGSIKLNEIRNGEGAAYGANDSIPDSLIAGGGVMDR